MTTEKPRTEADDRPELPVKQQLVDQHQTGTEDRRDRLEEHQRTTEERGPVDGDEWYRRLLDCVSDYIVVVTADGTIDYISPGVESTLGYDPAELVGMNAFAFVHPDDRATVRRDFETKLENPDTETSVEYRVQAADGTYRWTEARGSNYLDDRVIGGILLTIRDVTERKRDEQELVAERDARSTLQRKLANATSMREFATTVCAELVAMDAIVSAQVVTGSPTDDLTLLASSDAGDDPDTPTVPDQAGWVDAATAALRETEPQMVSPADTESRDTGGDADQPASAAIAVPATHNSVTHGVLLAHATEQRVLDESHLSDLLLELADVLGYAMASNRRQQALAADEWSQLTVTVETAGTPLSQVVDVTGTPAQVVTVVPRCDDTVLCYLTVEDPAEFVVRARDVDGIEHAQRVDDGDPRVQLIVAGSVPSAVVADHDGRVDEATVGPATTTLTVRFLKGTAFDPVLDTLTSVFDDVVTTEFTTQPADTGASSDPLSGLTDRQQEVLEVAYRAGYFEKPRAQNAGEVADQLGVSRPTYDEVLRAAQRNLLSALLDDN